MASLRHFLSESSSSVLPKYAHEKLTGTLHEFTPKASAMRNTLDEDGVRVAFLQMVVDLMREYRACVRWNGYQLVFDRVSFCERQADYEVSHLHACFVSTLPLPPQFVLLPIRVQ